MRSATWHNFNANLLNCGMNIQIRKIRKYAIHTEAWYHYAVGSIVTLVAIMIAFLVALKCFT